MARRWTTEEDGLLAQLYAAGVTRRGIAARLRRTEDAIDARRRSLGLCARALPRSWSASEDRLIRAATAAGIPASELAPRLRRPVEAVRRRRRVLGLGLAPGRPFAAAEDEMLRAAWRTGGDLDVVAAALERSRESLRLRAHALGLARPKPRPRWRPEEDDLLRHGYREGLTCPAIASRLPGRSAGAVTARARKLGLATYARLWTSAEERRLVELADAGAPVNEVAAEFVRTPGAVRRRARRLGLPSLSRSVHPPARRRWSPEEDELLRRHANLNPGLLAALVSRSDEAACRRLVLLGLRRGRERSPHHPVQASGELTPGEQRLLARELELGGARRLLSLARRLARTPGTVKRLGEGLRA